MLSLNPTDCYGSTCKKLLAIPSKTSYGKIEARFIPCCLNVSMGLGRPLDDSLRTRQAKSGLTPTKCLVLAPGMDLMRRIQA